MIPTAVTLDLRLLLYQLEDGLLSQFAGYLDSDPIPNKDKLENPCLVQEEQIKNSKHDALYAPIGFACFCSCRCLLRFLRPYHSLGSLFLC